MYHLCYFVCEDEGDVYQERVRSLASERVNDLGYFTIYVVNKEKTTLAGHAYNGWHWDDPFDLPEEYSTLERLKAVIVQEGGNFKSVYLSQLPKE